MRKLMTIGSEGIPEELISEYSETIPLPDPLARRLFLNQCRGMRISSDGQLLDTSQMRVDTHTLFLKETVRNLRVWDKDEVWEWDSAGPAWLRHSIVRS